VSKDSTRAIRVDLAVKCCEQRINQIELELRKNLGTILTHVYQMRTSDDYGSLLALVPGVRRLPAVPRTAPPPSIIKYSRAAPLALGAIVLLSADALSSLRAQTAALDAINGIIHMVDVLFERDYEDLGDCQKCMRKFMWKQKQKQVKLKLTVRKRLG